jgi:hypothetical protein
MGRPKYVVAPHLLKALSLSWALPDQRSHPNPRREVSVHGTQGTTALCLPRPVHSHRLTMGWGGVGLAPRSQAHRAMLEQALRNDPVLAPMFDYSNCIIMGGVPGSDCVFDVSRLPKARASVGRLSADGLQKSLRKLIKRPQEKAVSMLYGDSKYGHLACEVDNSCRLGEEKMEEVDET